jgi:hypothetical protein
MEPASSEKTPQENVKTAAPAVRLPPGNGLDSPRFRNLPPEARDYLETLAGAFQKKDKEFLISQGEAQYEKELRYGYDEETYLAMLYRIGSYSEERPSAAPGLPQMNTSLILTIEYSGWEETGPALYISANIYLQNNGPIPCAIMLLWRLTEPKILGIWP